MSKTKYTVRQLEEQDKEQFATSKLFSIAEEFYEKHLVPFADDLNTADVSHEKQCSHRKHVGKLFEDLLRAKPNTPLELIFDERGVVAAYHEMDFEPGDAFNANFEQRCAAMKRFFRNAFNRLSKKQRFERLVVTYLGKLMDVFYSTITEPEKLHIYKHEWLKNFNEQNVDMLAPGAANTEEVQVVVGAEATTEA